MSQAETAARRERLLARRAQLSEERRLQLEQRLLGDLPPAAGAAAPGLLVEITPLPPRPGGASTAAAAARRPLFCVHPAGGDVLCFVPLARWLGADQPCFGLRSHGLEAGEEPLRSIEEMASRYVAEVRKAQPVGPYLLAGWSFGGLVAFEMAQQLSRAGRRVQGLALIDTRSPSANARLVGIEPELMKAYLLVEHAKSVAKISARELPIRPQDLLGLDLQAQLDLIVREMDLREALPPDTELRLVRRYLELRLARFQAIKNYSPLPYAGPVTLFRAQDVYTDTALAEAAEIFAEAARSPTYGWDEIVRGPLAVRPVPGDHESLVYEPHVRELAASMRGFLDELAPAAELA
jgi:thioesterase domain-containing protein